MLKKAILRSLAVCVAISAIFVAGCETAGESGALIGAGGGALAGQAIGGNTTGTLIGTGVGALGGYVVGNEMDKSKAKQQQQVTAPQQQTYNAPPTQSNSVTVWLNNSNGSQTPVHLTQNSDGSYTGPKGERYPTMPSEAQLKQLYGM
jgi:predicted lipid-binding transport protein (Tim44 family)